jgi:hypothetical protein
MLVEFAYVGKRVASDAVRWGFWRRVDDKHETLPRPAEADLAAVGLDPIAERNVGARHELSLRLHLSFPRELRAFRVRHTIQLQRGQQVGFDRLEGRCRTARVRRRFGVSRMRGIDLYELRRQFARWEVGTWFEINDAVIGWKKGVDRPFVIFTDYDGGPLADTRPRSSTTRSTFEHAAHEPHHEAGCRIDRDGWIHVQAVASMRAELLETAYACTEPDTTTVNRLKALA